MFPGVQLAAQYSRPRSFPVLVEPKIDGFRLVAVVGREGVTFYSRHGNSSPYTRNLRFIADQILSRVPAGYVLDGELQISGKWRATAMARKENLSPSELDILKSNAVFSAFDLYPIGERNTPQQIRRDALNRLIGGGTQNLRVLPARFARSEDEIMDAYHDFVNRGYEGVIVKNLDAPYVTSRSSAWMKLKPNKTIDGTVIGYKAGTGRLSGTLGAVVVRLRNGKQVSVGTGFSDAARDQIWRNRSRYFGKVLEMIVEKSDVSDARHPRFHRWRVDIDKPRTRKPARRVRKPAQRVKKPAKRRVHRPKKPKHTIVRRKPAKRKPARRKTSRKLRRRRR